MVLLSFSLLITLLMIAAQYGQVTESIFISSRQERMKKMLSTSGK
jgi:hypothetical protein